MTPEENKHDYCTDPTCPTCPDCILGWIRQTVTDMNPRTGHDLDMKQAAIDRLVRMDGTSLPPPFRS